MTVQVQFAADLVAGIENLRRERVLSLRRAALGLLRRRHVHPVGFGLWTQPELVLLEVVRPIKGDAHTARGVVASAIDEVIRKAHALGGSMEYVHGVGTKPAHLMREEHGPGLEVARQIKSGIDPSGLLNPGKLGL